MELGTWKVGYAVVSLTVTTESSPLPAGTSAQLAELIALSRALEVTEGQRANIYTDYKYAFLVLHVHAIIWKEINYLPANGSPIKYHCEIGQLLCTVFLPNKWPLYIARGTRRE